MQPVMRKKYITVSLALLFIASLFLYSFSAGITGVTRKSSAPGCTCHGSLTPSVNVRIDGPDSVYANDSADYIVTITGGPLVMGGTNIAAKLGTLIPGTKLKTLNGELTHIQPYPPVSGAVSFNFKYKSPGIPGADTIYANGNSVDFNGFSTGDNWNYAMNKSIVVTAPTGIANANVNAGSFILNQNYPNPFNPETEITFSIPKSSYVNLTVHDISGKLTSVLVNSHLTSGNHSIKWNASEFPNGVYFYTLKSGKSVITKKMILLK